MSVILNAPEEYANTQTDTALANTEAVGYTGDDNGLTAINGVDYNSANSDLVQDVEHVVLVDDVHRLEDRAEINSVTQKYRNGLLTSERYYGNNGNAYLDIDYTDHGNPKSHPVVPHIHRIWFDENGNFHRGQEVKTEK